MNLAAQACCALECGQQPQDQPGIETAKRILAALSVEDLESLAAWWSPSALRRRRQEERNAAIREMAAERIAHTGGSGAALAEMIAKELERYAASAWRFECKRDAPADPRHVVEHRILRLSRGNPPGARTIRRILAGQKQTRQ